MSSCARVLVRLVALPPLAALVTACVEPGRAEGGWEVLGRRAQAEVHTTTRATAPELLASIRAATVEVESLLRREDPEAPLGRLNRRARDEFHTVESAELYRAVRLALGLAKESEGAYDPTVGPLVRVYREAWPAAPPTPAIDRALARVDWSGVVLAEEADAVRFRDPGMELDLDGLAAGLALDVAARRFSMPGSRGGRLSLDGQLYLWGEPAQGGEWEVELVDPRRSGALLGRVRVGTRAIAVVGRGPALAPPAELLLDPRTGRPAASDVEVAVSWATSGVDAAGLARALVVAGSPHAGGLLGRLRRTEALLVVRGEGGPRVVASASLAGRFSPSGDLLAEVSGDVRFVLPPAER